MASSSGSDVSVLYWMGPELYGAKWRNFKLALITQRYLTDPPALAGDSEVDEPCHRPPGA